jgi:periplasmic protein TonB
LATYRLRPAYDETPLRSRASGVTLAVAINVLLLLVLLSIGVIPMKLPEGGQAPLVVNLVQSENKSTASKSRTETRRTPREAGLKPRPSLRRRMSLPGSS